MLKQELTTIALTGLQAASYAALALGAVTLITPVLEHKAITDIANSALTVIVGYGWFGTWGILYTRKKLAQNAETK